MMSHRLDIPEATLQRAGGSKRRRSRDAACEIHRLDGLRHKQTLSLKSTNYCEYCCEDVCGGDPSCRSDSNKLGPRCLLPDPSAGPEGRRRTAGRSRM
jgi:hypothetical protein